MLHYPYRIELGSMHMRLDTAAVGLWLTYISMVFSALSGGRLRLQVPARGAGRS